MGTDGKGGKRETGTVSARSRLRVINISLNPGNAVLDPLDVTAAHALDLAAEFQVAADPVIVQDAEAVNESKRPSYAFEHSVGIEF